MAIGWKKDYFRYKDFFLNVLNQYKVKPNFKKYLELMLSIVTIALFAIFAIRPTVLTIIDLNKEIGEKQETIAKLQQKIKNLQIANNVLQTESERLFLINQSVPDKSNPEILVKQLEGLANSNSLSIVSLSLSDAVLRGDDKKINKSGETASLPDNASQLPFTITVTGPYDKLFSFTNDIQNLRRPAQIDSFAINSNYIDNEKVLSLIISGRVPYLLETSNKDE